MGDQSKDIILSIRGMSKSFGRNRVLDHINLDVRKGTVMGLMGENGAGKSTMMKCLFGTYQKDEGTIYLDGKEVNFSGPKDALENGIAMVHQELNQCLERNVVDNLFLGRYPVNSLGMIDEGRMKNEASELFRKLGMTVNLDQPMRNMSVSQRQMCEIAKAISYNSKVIVLDEPTSSLTVQEVDKLFDMMRMLRDQGISLIYISHKMDEIFEICDDISVLRDGNLVMTKSAKETNMNELITAMVGRVLENRFPPVDNQPKDVILSIQHLSTKYEPYLQDVTFDVREGEIFGLYGLVGAGRTELLETIFGIRTRAAGRVYLNHKLMNFSCAKEAMDYGFALITEERKANGLFLKGNLTFNTTIANLNAYKKGAALSEPKMTKATANEIKVMHTKCLGPNDMISSLSHNDLLSGEMRVSEGRSDIDYAARREAGLDVEDALKALHIRQRQREECRVHRADHQAVIAVILSAGLEGQEDYLLRRQPVHSLLAELGELVAVDVLKAGLVGRQIVAYAHAVRIAAAHIVLHEVDHGAVLAAHDLRFLHDAHARQRVADVVAGAVRRTKAHLLELFLRLRIADAAAFFQCLRQILR